MRKSVLMGILALSVVRPGGAAEDLPAGSAVQLTGVGRQDAFWRHRKGLIGQSCIVEEEGMHHNGQGWWGGGMTCEDGGYYYFFQSSFDVISGPALPSPKAPAATKHFAPGARVTIRDVSPSDAYHAERAAIVGLGCTVKDEPVAQKSNGWYGGAFRCDDGLDYFFFEAAMEAGGAPPPAPAPPEAWPVGARVKVDAISPSDTYYQDRAAIVGKVCTVEDAALAVLGDWVGGQVRCDDGASYYFFEARVTAASPTSGAAQAPAVAASPSAAVPTPPEGGVPAGRLVKIADIAPQDATYATRAALVGRTCSVIEAPLVPTGAGWLAGRMLCDDGKQYQFFRVKVAVP